MKFGVQTLLDLTRYYNIVAVFIKMMYVCSIFIINMNLSLSSYTSYYTPAFVEEPKMTITKLDDTLG